MCFPRRSPKKRMCQSVPGDERNIVHRAVLYHSLSGILRTMQRYGVGYVWLLNERSTRDAGVGNTPMVPATLLAEAPPDDCSTPSLYPSLCLHVCAHFVLGLHTDVSVYVSLYRFLSVVATPLLLVFSILPSVSGPLHLCTLSKATCLALST